MTSQEQVQDRTAKAIAEQELREEGRKANVQSFKQVLKQIKAAKRIVKNLEAELVDLEEDLQE